MELKGLKAVFLGDSITEGVGASKVENCYWGVLGRNTGLEVKGYGVGGTRIARQEEVINGFTAWNYDFIERATIMDKDADIVCVFGGTNDYGHGIAPIGNIDDNTPYTFYGALNYLYTYLLKTYPNAFIFICTPLHRLNENDPRGDGLKEPMLPLKCYVEIIREVAEKYSLPVLDLFKVSGINPIIKELQDTYLPDGLHPNDRGYQKIAGIMEEFLKNSYHKK